MNIAEVEDRAVPAITLLRNGGRATEAHDLAQIVSQLKQPGKVEGALEGIIARCNMRWLGDLPLKNIGSTEWLQILSALESAARAELLLARNRSSHRRKADYEKAERKSVSRVAPSKAKSPWGANKARTTDAGSRLKNTKAQKKRFTVPSLRTLSATARDRGGVNPRWTDEGPIARASMPFWVALSLFLPPFALIAYSVLIVIDSTPDVFPPETILVEGEVDRWEALENYSPLGDKGIIYLAEHDAGYSVQEALGYGFGDIVAQLGAGEAVSLQVNADDMVEENQRVAAIADAIQNADTEGDYDVIVSQAERTGSLAAIPILELNIADETIYSRLQLIATARERIRNWALLGLAALFFLIVVARMRAD